MSVVICAMRIELICTYHKINNIGERDIKLALIIWLIFIFCTKPCFCSLFDGSQLGCSATVLIPAVSVAIYWPWKRKMLWLISHQKSFTFWEKIEDYAKNMGMHEQLSSACMLVLSKSDQPYIYEYKYHHVLQWYSVVVLQLLFNSEVTGSNLSKSFSISFLRASQQI